MTCHMQYNSPPFSEGCSSSSLLRFFLLPLKVKSAAALYCFGVLGVEHDITSKTQEWVYATPTFSIHTSQLWPWPSQSH